MKALGIVRKIDDLGRIVIPKETRNSYGWKSGQPMEMFATEQGVVIRAFQTDTDKQEIVESIQTALEMTDNPAVVEILHGALDFINKQ